MAEALIDSLSDEQLDPARYHDVHRETLTALIDAKATGRPPAPDAGSGAAPPDLLDALRASIEAAKQRRSSGNGGRRRTAEPVGPKKKAKSPAPAAGETRPPRSATEPRFDPAPQRLVLALAPLVSTAVSNTPHQMRGSDAAGCYNNSHEQLSGLWRARGPLPRHVGRPLGPHRGVHGCRL